MTSKLEMDRIREALARSGKIYEAEMELSLYSMIGESMNRLAVIPGTPLIAAQQSDKAPWMVKAPFTVMLASPKDDVERYLVGVNIPADILREAGPLQSLAAQASAE